MERGYMLALLLSILFVTPGCVEQSDAYEEEISDENTVPEKLNLVAQTAGRSIDRGSSLDILSDANGSNTMILWVSTGCSGCHDWTEMISAKMENGSLSNDTRIITVHRYPSFETKEDVIDVYANENSSRNSLWPVLLPTEGQKAIDVSEGKETEMVYWEAFENPSTPSFTIIDGEGKTIWKNKKYWANETTLNDALEILNRD
ncbi:MAG: hypothetical protein VW862_07070 [Euryarchaeota archaeon]